LIVTDSFPQGSPSFSIYSLAGIWGGGVVEVSLRILSVDDLRDAAESLAQLLMVMGHRAMAVTDPGKVEAMVEAFRPHIVFLDIGMPGIDGWEIARRLRERFQPEVLRLVAMTAHGSADAHVQSRRAGFDAHLTKPADILLLESILRQFFPEAA